LTQARLKRRFSDETKTEVRSDSGLRFFYVGARRAESGKRFGKFCGKFRFPPLSKNVEARKIKSNAPTIPRLWAFRVATFVADGAFFRFALLT